MIISIGKHLKKEDIEKNINKLSKLEMPYKITIIINS